MNPNVPYDASSALGALGALGLVSTLIGVAFIALVILLYYIFFKACVRNGVIEALKKTGYVDALGHRTYPPVAVPVQTYSASPAPTYQPHNTYQA